MPPSVPRLPKVRRSLAGWAVVVAAILLWQLAAPWFQTGAVASFTAALASLAHLLSWSTLSSDVLPSVGRVLAGFAISAVAGVTVGALLGFFRGAEPWVRPIIDFARAVPPPLVIPVAILILGLQSRLIVGCIVLAAVWPVLLNTADAVAQVEPQYLDVARSCRVGRLRTLCRVSLPASLPMILAGLRTALTISLIVMVLTEMLAGSSGIGYLILFAQQTFSTGDVYGGVLLLAVLGWALDNAMVLAERRVLRNRPESARGTGVQ